MKYSILSILLFFVFGNQAVAQNASFKGQLVGDDGSAVMFANIADYTANDSSLVKVETTDENGIFFIKGLASGTYNFTASFLGLQDLNISDIELATKETKDLGVLEMMTASVELDAAIVTAKRPIVEVKSDRTVFNVKGTINSSGDNGMDLLRKAPGVLVDNNNNITVLGRSGVMLYVDGKRLPLTGDDLIAYLQNLNSEQIDKIDIITNPGARYEAQGNAGIIDIRLKRNENHGTNGSVSSNTTRAYGWRNNVSTSLNHRNKLLNTYGQLSFNRSEVHNNMDFDDFQNGVRIQNNMVMINNNESAFLLWGTDFNVGKDQTLGFLVSGNLSAGDVDGNSESQLSSIDAPNMIDSILVAENLTRSDFNSQTFNINYVLNRSKTNLNIDVDYGRYRRDLDTDQPNT
jgi:hypothetical protein